MSEYVGLSFQAPLSSNSTCLLQNQLLMRPLQPGNPCRGGLAAISSLHREGRGRGKMSLFLKDRHVRWSRLWLPVVRGPEHPQARGYHPRMGHKRALGLLCFPEHPPCIPEDRVGSKQSKGPVDSRLGGRLRQVAGGPEC